MGDTGNGFDKNPQNINKKGAPKKEWTFKELSNRTDGMPKQAVDVTSKGEQIGGFDIIKPKIKNGEEEITIHTDDKTTSGLENPTG